MQIKFAIYSLQKHSSLNAFPFVTKKKILLSRIERLSLLFKNSNNKHHLPIEIGQSVIISKVFHSILRNMIFNEYIRNKVYARDNSKGCWSVNKFTFRSSSKMLDVFLSLMVAQYTLKQLYQIKLAENDSIIQSNIMS